jgi:hypothetical protein
MLIKKMNVIFFLHLLENLEPKKITINKSSSIIITSSHILKEICQIIFFPKGINHTIPNNLNF